MITPLEALISAHAIGDWLLQTKWQAENKDKGSFFNEALFRHCGVYTIVLAPVFFYFNIAWWWFLIVFVSHLIIDRRWPIIKFIQLKEKITGGVVEEPPFWLILVTDQIVHILILALIVALL